MKKLILLLFSFLIIVDNFAQNGLKEGSYFLLLKSNESISINIFDKNNIQEIKVFSINEKSIFTTDQKKRVVVLDTAKNYISLHDIQTSSEIYLNIPFDFKPKTILLNDENIFIGGELGKVMLVQYNIKNKKWYNLEIPTEVIYPRKAIDDLVVNDSLLFAIDNIVMPKFIIFYRLNTYEKLIYSHLKELKSNGPYEGIRQSKITPKHLGLISGTFSGYIGAIEYITVYDNKDLSRSFAIPAGSKKSGYYTYNDIIILGEKIIIASKEKGLGIFKIKSSYFKGADIYGNNDFNEHVSSSKIKYKEFKNENIKSLTILPNLTTKIILTLEDKSGLIKNKIVDI